MGRVWLVTRLAVRDLLHRRTEAAVLLLGLSAVNAVFTAWSTVLDARYARRTVADALLQEA